MRVLVVDDDDIARDSFVAALSADGHTVTTALGRRALRVLDSHQVDAMVVDILMPEVDGIEMILHAQKLPRPPRIVAVSGGGKISAEQCLTLADSLGANAVFRKPVETEQLIRSVEPPRRTATTNAVRPHRLGRRPSILAIDDDPILLDLLRRHLSDYDVRTATGGEEALAILSFARPNLILLDVSMPLVDGIETVRRIRKRPQLANCKVMMLTSVTHRMTMSEAIDVGANGYMLKPFTREILIDRIGQLIQKSDPSSLEI
jgi:CheY-like chemotaxis protein